MRKTIWLGILISFLVVACSENKNGDTANLSTDVATADNTGSQPQMNLAMPNPPSCRTGTYLGPVYCFGIGEKVVSHPSQKSCHISDLGGYYIGSKSKCYCSAGDPAKKCDGPGLSNPDGVAPMCKEFVPDPNPDVGYITSHFDTFKQCTDDLKAMCDRICAGIAIRPETSSSSIQCCISNVRLSPTPLSPSPSPTPVLLMP